MTIHKKILLVACCLIPFLITAQPTSKQISEFDQFVLRGVKEWDIPGLGVVVVKDNKVIYKKGIGVREIGKPDPVDTQTLFACASTTKAITATGMGMLVDEGKVNWDDAVVKYLPDFKLYDANVTRELKIRDLFTHNSGVGNSDFLWVYMDIPDDEIVKRLEFVKPSYSLRSSFIYQNIFYAVAGEVIERVSGRPWAEFTRERIFKPLQMTRTLPLEQEAVKMSNIAVPHFQFDGKTTPIEHITVDNIAPAGSVWSCVDDIGKWVACMLDSSKYAGGRLVSPATWSELFKPQVIVPAEQFYPSMELTKPNWTTYALGWFQQDYKGAKVNFHTGSIDGFVAIHGQLPAQKLGVYVFSNRDHAEFRHALMFKAFDLFALGGNRDWSADLMKVYTKIKMSGDKRTAEFDAKRQTGTSPSVPTEKFAGRYADRLYGEVVVEKLQDGLTIRINNLLTVSVDHWHYNTFAGLYKQTWWGKTFVTFQLNDAGDVDSIEIDGMKFKRSSD